MKYFVLVAIFLSGSVSALGFDFNREGNLREHEPLILDVSEVEVRSCAECHVPMTFVSYVVEAKDAYLGISERQTAAGSFWTPYLKAYKTKVDFQLREDEAVLHFIPDEGRYVGTLYQQCAPWAVGADGSCRKWLVKFHFEGKVGPVLQ